MLRRTFVTLTLSLVSFGIAHAGEPLKSLKIGVTAGLHEEVLQQVVPLAKQKGLDIKIVVFQDYIQPNFALAAGDLDANIFQTKPFLDAAVRDRGYQLVPTTKTLTFPMAFYSKKFKNFKDIPDGAKVGIPNDPSQGGRALLLLQQNGIIKLKPDTGFEPSPLDVTDNPKKLRFVELEAAQLPRSLGDLDVSAINGNYANTAGLNPSKDGLLIEDATSPWVNYIVVREKDKNQSWVKSLGEAYQQPVISEFIKKKYDGAVIPAF